MKFAVTIVTYNRLELLKECVKQVLSQTVPFSYICIVDNNSTDGTSKYLDQLGLRPKQLPLTKINQSFSFFIFRKISAEQAALQKVLRILEKQTVTGS